MQCGLVTLNQMAPVITPMRARPQVLAQIPGYSVTGSMNRMVIQFCRSARSGPVTKPPDHEAPVIRSTHTDHASSMHISHTSIRCQWCGRFVVRMGGRRDRGFQNLQSSGASWATDRSMVPTGCAGFAERHNLILIGPTGIGKSFLCCAFVERACRRGFSARYVRMARLLQELAVGRGDGSYARLLIRLAKLDLLAIDDWMIAPLRDAERRDLTEVSEDRAERAATLIASQLPVTDWHAVIGDANQADAICDRLLHDVHRIELQGRSMRRTHRAPKTRTPETR